MILGRRSVLAGMATLATPAMVRAQPGPVIDILADGRAFTEGVVTTRNGDVLFVEIAAGRLSRLNGATGVVSTVAQTGGGPNGATIGPDGQVYVANNGGLSFSQIAGRMVPTGIPADYRGGSIQRVDPATGAVTTLYDSVDGERLKAPNDILCDAWGDLWFTDTGKSHPRYRDHGGLYWAKRDGSAIKAMAYPLMNPNGLAFAPDRRTLYVAYSDRREIAAFTVTGPGTLAPAPPRMVAALGGTLLFDNVAVEQSGNLVVACVLSGELVTLSPTGQELARLKLPDTTPTALAFGGPDWRSLYVALAGRGAIARIAWPRPGLPAPYRL